MFTNEDRISSVAPAINAFAAAMGLDDSLDADGPESVAGDMICNILHWVARKHPDGRAAALVALRYGAAHYTSESYIDYTADWVDELGPEAFIEIHASCNGEVWHTQTGEERAALISTYPL
ncbi:hypothetical protein V2V90_23365 (plasmid) [Agrobacterium leguminum]|uniref:hypothetical protein n=1 Tax=Agrobacterium leguminum TaxID=2792015 RepID=UPI0030CA6B7F